MFWRTDPEKLIADFLDGKSKNLMQIFITERRIVGLGERAIPALLKALENRDGAGVNSIGKLLRKIGRSGLIALRQGISDGSPPQQRNYLRALMEFEADAASEIGFLTQLLDSPDSEVRGWAAHALGRIGPASDQPAQQLANMASNDAPSVQRSALFALERIGFDPVILAEICGECLSTADDGVFFAASTALKKTGCDPTRFAGLICERLNRPERPNCPDFSAMQLLQKAQSLDQASVEHLFGYLSKPASMAWNRQGAISVLWHHTRDAKRLIPILEAMLNSEDELESACDAICALGPAAAPLLPKLLNKMSEHHDYWDFCWAAVDAISAMGPAAESALPMVEQMKSHPSELVRVRAEKAIRSINGEPTDNESQ